MVYDVVSMFFVHLFLRRFVIPLAYRCQLILRGLDIIGDEAVIFGLVFTRLTLAGKAASIIHRAIQPQLRFHCVVQQGLTVNIGGAVAIASWRSYSQYIVVTNI
jgi:hypothetical protein